jgi:CDP-diacylglycerol--serine O-phosphatidyltransferase
MIGATMNRRRRVLSALPHAFTLGSLFCGFYAIAQSFHATGLDGLLRAALAILFGAFFDAFDGRIARITRTQSALGLHLDSLADVVTFGVAPAALVYNWGLDRLGVAGLCIAFVWVACGALRLARFNALSQDEHEPASASVSPVGQRRPGKYIVGLPIPAAASVIVSLVVLAQRTGTAHQWAGRWGLAAVVLALSYLMVSRIRFRSFKAVAWRSRRTAVTLVLILTLSVAVWIGLRGAYVFVFLLLAYIAIGLVEAALRRTPA